jgi:hypothetical protein
MLTAALSFIKGAWGGVVVKALHYQSEGSIPGHWGFFRGIRHTRIFLGVKTAGA